MQSTPLSARNPRIRRLKRLVARSKARSEERAFVVEGLKLVAEALASPLVVSEIYHGPDLGYGLPQGAEAVECFVVDASVLGAALDAVNPQPIAAVVVMPEDSGSALPSSGPVLVAVELRDPGNLGTLLRTAEAAGFAGVAVVGDSVDHFSPKVVRASAGSLFRIPVCSWSDANAALADLRDQGRCVVAAVVDVGATNYDEIDLTNAAILLGNEPHGLAPEVVAQADQSCTISLAPSVESLNVAAAGAVLCFEAARQTRKSAGEGPSR